MPTFSPAGAENFHLRRRRARRAGSGSRRARPTSPPSRASACSSMRPPTEPVFIRAHALAGEWGPWSELDFSADDGADPGTPEAAAAERTASVTSEPVVTGSSNGFEINGPVGIGDSADVVVVRDVQHRALATATPLADAEVPAPFGIHSPRRVGCTGPGLHQLRVHHQDRRGAPLVTQNDYSPADVPWIIRNIQAYHMDGRSAVRRHRLQLRDRQVRRHLGGPRRRHRPARHRRPRPGLQHQHRRRHGARRLHPDARPTAAAIESVANVIGWKLFLHNADPAGRVDFTSGGSPSIPRGSRATSRGSSATRTSASPGVPARSSRPCQIRTRAQECKNFDPRELEYRSARSTP